MYKASQKKVKKLFDKLTKTTLIEPTGIFGSTSNQSVLHELISSVTRLKTSLDNGESHQDNLLKFNEVVQHIDTARIMGLISEKEIEEYSQLLDEISAMIETEAG